MWNWTSGASSPSRVRTKPPPSPPLDVHGPLPSASYWAKASGVAAEIRLPLSVRTTKLSIGWSWRFWPTGSSWRVSIPSGASPSFGPTPESIKSCGEW
jgi:hypothetical protein